MGLYSIADQLGVRLASGVRERQWNPRYLTIALVGMATCDDALVLMGHEKGIPAWQVYEWIVITALVREWRGTQKVTGIPGHEKVASALAANDVVCERTYLRTANVFGFHGIYRVLGVRCELFDASPRMLERGARILQAWEADEKLEGFVTGSGPGREFRRELRREVQRGLENGHVREPPKGLREQICKHLTPHRTGAQEATLLWTTLLSNDRMRREYAELLTCAEGQQAWIDAGGSEHEFHGWASARASGPLRQLVTAVQKYEALSRSLADAWEETLFRLTEARRAMSPAELAEAPSVRELADDGAGLLENAVRELGVIDPQLRVRAEGSFGWLGESRNPVSTAERLIVHHTNVQRGKSRPGKRTWFDPFADGRVAVRPGYTRDAFEARRGVYVNQYRAQPLWNFATHLGRVAAREA
jgi:hypothetical protein